MQKIENISLGKNKSNSKTALSYLKRKKKSLPTKYLYDEKGSNLFEKICNTEEYYLTRTEQKILNKYSAEIISYTKGSNSSSNTKLHPYQIVYFWCINNPNDSCKMQEFIVNMVILVTEFLKKGIQKRVAFCK